MPVEQPLAIRSRLVTVAAVGYLLILTILLVMPSPLWVFGSAGTDFEETVDRSVSDLIQHTAAYAILTVLILAAMERRGRRGAMIGIVFCLSHAIGTEILQYFIPFRYLDWRDMAANAVGVVAGRAFFQVIFESRRNSKKLIQEGR